MPSGVECHAGYAYPDRPKALYWEGDRLLIVEILARWRTPGSIHFRVRTADERLFDLTYRKQTDEWQIDLD